MASFEQPKLGPEISKKKPWQEERGYRKVRGFIEEQAENMRKEGFPVGSDGRISPEKYLGVYSQEALSEDKRKVQDRKRKFSQNIFSNRDVENSEAGEGFEVLTMAILQEFLGREGFYILRTAEFDDIFNNVDLLILDRKTGAAICGLDDVQSADSGPRAGSKKIEAGDKNKRYGGAKIQYGFVPKKESGDKIIFQLGKMEKIPIVVFSASPETVEDRIETFGTKFDKKLFDDFLKTTEDQLNGLDRDSKVRILPLKNSLDNYKKQKDLVEA